MSYALETKKRKFERILESLTDGSTSPGRPSVSSRSTNVGTVTAVQSASVESSKRRRITPISKLQQLKSPSTASLTAHYLPSSRLAFLERLESFRQVTQWHIPSTSRVNAVQWAKRGWICEDTDTVGCPTCKERLHVDIDINTDDVAEREPRDGDEDDPLALANEVLESLTSKYQDLTITAHTPKCPWRRRGCDSSIQRIEGLLNTSNVLAALGARYGGIVECSDNTPQVVTPPPFEAYTVDEEEIRILRLHDHPGLDLNNLKLAICGWQKKEKDVVECRHCFRSLGLWLYRGTEPTIENLDAIDSHLEYCPWRSAEAQDTKLSLPYRGSGTSGNDLPKQKIPGWLLVYLAVVKDNNKRRGPHARKAVPVTDTPDHEDLESSSEQLSPEQREKKMKDLIRRIRDLKKPFNVRSLLRRNNKSTP